MAPRRSIAVLLAIALVSPAACSDTDDTLVIYSGRNKELVGGILEQLKQTIGGNVEVRYGGSAEMAAQILEEGDGTQADVFFSQDAGALGALTEQGKLAVLPPDVLGLVPEKYRADNGTWVATSARSRVVAYDPGQVTELPANADAILDPKWRGKVGYAPTNASWQAFVTGLRVIRGEEGAKQWLAAFKANEPKRFENNIAILDAVDKGQLALGLINHYYWYARVAERGADTVKAKLHFVGGGDPLGLVNVAGVGVVNGSAQNDAAIKAVRFLVSDQAQRYFADQTAEYPANPDVPPGKHQLPPLGSLHGPDIDLSKLSSLQRTLSVLQEVGLS
ncbi:extracellular solute-binding protein [Kibdelosporangium philippinense]|uniref:Extracellular solute-binding protein n=1 Tax=Kibdelosporangium philippinense TaxID=211113 RepID=A0ABS9A079_9PSEU|nr:extracellular solute-binding protein [Kibdelosporangium philippinense]MCE7012162.1 extracellular solute-binding protein [Kibdelosporangium philippinense]